MGPLLNYLGLVAGLFFSTLAVFGVVSWLKVPDKWGWAAVIVVIGLVTAGAAKGAEPGQAVEGAMAVAGVLGVVAVIAGWLLGSALGEAGRD